MSFLAWKYIVYGHIINKMTSSLAFSLHSVKTLLLAAETTETKARLGINSRGSFLNRNESKSSALSMRTMTFLQY